jgi:aspartyl-tRNA(Asn)/glutamyl-tRNA(Gln) amidotransferase subunit B
MMKSFNNQFQETTSSFEAVIGLEVHVELATKTKLFCSCPNRFGGIPNTHVCPVCLGLPGVLPVVNKEAVRLLLKAALALDCQVPPKSKFDRKNYFYPDMPKNYQISQYDLPFAVEGHVKIFSGDREYSVRIKRIHLEEDTGKSIHVGTSDGRMGQADYTLVDYNRAGVPLIEIVTYPDLKTPQEAGMFLQKLRLILQTVGVSDCKMEEGRMRCDANVSVRLAGLHALGTKVEIKNMNSFKSVRDALAFEIERQKKILLNGGKILQETRGWDEDNKRTFLMRSKEEAHDYRYFPEPDLPPFEITTQQLEEIRRLLPEPPDAKKKRYTEAYNLSNEEAEALASNLSLSNFFDETMKWTSNAKEVCHWLRGEILGYLNEKGIEISQSRLLPQSLACLVDLITDGSISGKMAKEILPELFETGANPKELVKQKGLTQISDEKELEPLLLATLTSPASASAIKDYLRGNKNAFGFLMGTLMKLSHGKANPKLAHDLLKRHLEQGEEHLKEILKQQEKMKP